LWLKVIYWSKCSANF